MENNQERDSLLMRWSKFFITKYRVSILVILAIVVAGLWGVSTNQRQDFPTIPLNFVYVSAIYPGASPADVEREVIIPLEQTIKGFEEVDYIQSSAQNSYGDLQVFLKSGDDLDAVTTKLGDEFDKVGLPDDADVGIQTITAAGPAIALGIVGDNGQTTTELLEYAAEVQTRLETSSSDIKYVEIAPSNEYELKITLDTAELAKNRLNFDLVRGAIQSQLISLPGGAVTADDGRKESITINAPIQSQSDIENISFGFVKLSDIAEIERVPKNSEAVTYVGYIEDGVPYSKQSVYVMVYKNDEGDVITISEAVSAEIEDIKSSGVIPEEVDIVTAYNTAPYVEDQISTLLNNGYLGLILILVVLLFFINLRTALVVAFVIPTVFLIGLFVLAAIGYSLNILTLFAMILTLGILVDNAIVIAEGMVHELDKGASRLKAALLSVRKLGPPVTAATLTTVVVFIPFASIGGIMGDFLKYIPYTIMIIILASFFVAVSITPLLGRWILKKQTEEERKQRKIKGWQKALVIPAFVMYGQKAVDALSDGYKRMMTKVYKKMSLKIGVLAITTVLLGLSFGYFAPQLDFEQFPTTDGAQVQVSVSFPAGVPTDQKNDVFMMVQDELIQLPHFKNFYAFGNTIFSEFTDPKDREDGMVISEIIDKFEVELDEVRAKISDDIVITPQSSSYGPPMDQFAVVVNFLGTDSDKLTNATNNLEEFLNDQEGIKKIENGPKASLIPAIEVNLKQDELAKRGVNSMVAAGTVNAIFAEQKIGSIVLTDGGLSDNVMMVFSDQSTDAISDLEDLTVPTLTGGVVKLSDVADVQQVEKPNSIRRLENKRVATVSVELEEGADQAALDQAIRDYLTEDKLVALGLEKDGVTYGGEFSAFESDYSNLQIVFVLAMLAVYLILVYQFNSYFQPALIMFAVPLALIGVFPGLLLIGSSLNMISGLGIIALIGIVVNDAIVFISTFNRYKEEHPDDNLYQRLVRTGYTRFKPIFSTSITTIGGILPLTLTDPFWTGLGTSVISGLIFSTIGTLIAIPVLYSIFCNIRYKFSRKKEEC
jgi:multidrug efflux pump subunit AcrB